MVAGAQQVGLALAGFAHDVLQHGHAQRHQAQAHQCGDPQVAPQQKTRDGDVDHHHAGIHNALYAVADCWHIHVHQVLRIALRQLVAHPRVQPEPLLGKGLHQRAAL